MWAEHTSIAGGGDVLILYNLESISVVHSDLLKAELGDAVDHFFVNSDQPAVDLKKANRHYGLLPAQVIY